MKYEQITPEQARRLLAAKGESRPVDQNRVDQIAELMKRDWK